MNNPEIAVEFDSVSFAYGDLPVLEKASFHIHRGEFAALLGPNGSGKTTMLKLILGLEQPTGGSIKLFGAERSNNAVCRIGYVPQQQHIDQAFPITVRDVVRMGLLYPSRGYSAASAARAAGAKDKNAVDEAMKQADIADLAERSWRALSGGQRRRAMVARALASRPELLILDEPSANLDSESETRLFKTLKKLKGIATILIVTHDMDFVSVLTDRVLCLGNTSMEGGQGIVQHRIEAATEGSSRLRVLHGETISGNDCCEH